MSLNDIARDAGLAKSQMSRVVSGLVSQGRVSRRVDAEDGRSVRLTLSAAGKRIFAGLTAASEERNTRLLSCLTPREQELVREILDKLGKQARLMAREERSKG